MMVSTDTTSLVFRTNNFAVPFPCDDRFLFTEMRPSEFRKEGDTFLFRADFPAGLLSWLFAFDSESLSCSGYGVGGREDIELR
jgi:hypothetical protein